MLSQRRIIFSVNFFPIFSSFCSAEFEFWIAIIRGGSTPTIRAKTSITDIIFTLEVICFLLSFQLNTMVIAFMHKLFLSRLGIPFSSISPTFINTSITYNAANAKNCTEFYILLHFFDLLFYRGQRSLFSWENKDSAQILSCSPKSHKQLFYLWKKLLVGFVYLTLPKLSFCWGFVAWKTIVLPSKLSHMNAVFLYSSVHK